MGSLTNLQPNISFVYAKPLLVTSNQRYIVLKKMFNDFIKMFYIFFILDMLLTHQMPFVNHHQYLQ